MGGRQSTQPVFCQFYIVLPAPRFDDCAGIRQARKSVLVQAFTPESAVARLDERVLIRLTGFDQSERHAALGDGSSVPGVPASGIGAEHQPERPSDMRIEAGGPILQRGCLSAPPAPGHEVFRRDRRDVADLRVAQAAVATIAVCPSLGDVADAQRRGTWFLADLMAQAWMGLQVPRRIQRQTRRILYRSAACAAIDVRLRRGGPEKLWGVSHATQATPGAKMWEGPITVQREAPSAGGFAGIRL